MYRNLMMEEILQIEISLLQKEMFRKTGIGTWNTDMKIILKSSYLLTR